MAPEEVGARRDSEDTHVTSLGSEEVTWSSEGEGPTVA